MPNKNYYNNDNSNKSGIEFHDLNCYNEFDNNYNTNFNNNYSKEENTFDDNIKLKNSQEF